MKQPYRVFVAAITSRQNKRKLPTHYYLDEIEGLPANSIVLLEQLRTLDKKRLRERLTQLNKPCMEAIDIPLLISIGIHINELPPTERRGL